MTRREVMIHIHAEHSGLTLGGMPLFLDGAANGSDSFEELEEAENEQHFRELLSTTEAEPEISEMLVEGRLITTTRRVELIYEEMLEPEFGPSIVKIGFDRDRPAMISMLRSGAVSTAMIFENKLRHICIYNAPAVGFEVCISTVRVDNRLLTDGILALDYYMEIHGVQTEHCKMTITIKNNEE